MKRPHNPVSFHTLLAALASLACIGSASAATLSVGPGKTYDKPCAAINAAKDGDVIEITGNTTYSGDVCGIYRNNLTIRGVNGRPKIDAAGANAMGKAIWVVIGNGITVDNVEMLGARVPDHNGAAFRLEGTGFTLRNSFLHDNENGILSGPNENSDIVIEYTEFGHNGAGDGYSHNLYIGHVKSLTFRYSYSHDAHIGHNLKSRAITNSILYSRFSSTPAGQTGTTASGQPSYEIDLPNAGTSYVIGNVIEQPQANQNPNILAYGEEGASNPGNNLYVVNNTFLNDYTGGTFVMVGSQVSAPVLLQNNIFAGTGSITNQANAISKTNYMASVPGFVDRTNYDLHPTANTLVINAGSLPGAAPGGVPLTPVAQYKHPASGQARQSYGVIDIGAYEVTGTPVPAAKQPNWIQCAAEGGMCSFNGTQQVRYGTVDKYVVKVFSGGVLCANNVFGDPAPNSAKTCSYAPTDGATTAVTSAPEIVWTPCANEGGTCTFSGTREVRYGAYGMYATKTFTGSAPCGNGEFGDPILYTAKSCSYSSVTSTATAVPTWTACAGEGGTCTFSGTRQVRYGAEGVFVIKTFTGSVTCGNAAFGDPLNGYVKSCSYAN